MGNEKLTDRDDAAALRAERDASRPAHVEEVDGCRACGATLRPVRQRGDGEPLCAICEGHDGW